MPFVISTGGLGVLNSQITAPPLLTEEGTLQAIALDSVTRTRGPLSFLSSHNFGADGRTRIMLLAAGVELQPSETSTTVTAQAEDSQQRTFPVEVEHVSKLAGVNNCVTQINLRLPDEASNLSEITVSIRVRGVASNKVLVSLK